MFSFVNAAHFLVHYMVLVFPTAVIAMSPELGITYGELIPLATGTLVAFGLLSLPVGLLVNPVGPAQLLAAFFLLIGAASIAVAFASSYLALALTLLALGAAAAFYHPVGLTLLASTSRRLGHDLAVNGVWGNLGSALAAALTALLADNLGWRFAFVVPGAIAMALGIAFIVLMRPGPSVARSVWKRPRKSCRLPARFTRSSPSPRPSSQAASPTTSSRSPCRRSWTSSSPLGSRCRRRGHRHRYFCLRCAHATCRRAPCRPIFAAHLVYPSCRNAAYRPYHGLGLCRTVGALRPGAHHGSHLRPGRGRRRHCGALRLERFRGRAYGASYTLGFAVSALAIPLMGYLHAQGAGFAPVLALTAACGVMLLACAVGFSLAVARR